MRKYDTHQPVQIDTRDTNIYNVRIYSQIGV